jgi:rubrerythrin
MVRTMTEDNLRSAYAGESQAHMRYKIYSDRAKKNGYANVSRLFKAIAYAERVHAGNHYNYITSKGDTTTVSKAIFGTRNVSEDLQAGIDGETFEITEMYPAYRNVAIFQNEKGAELSFYWALEAEKTHANFFRKAKQSVDHGKDVQLNSIQVCEVCGHTIEGEAPKICPICKAPKEKFKEF